MERCRATDPHGGRAILDCTTRGLRCGTRALGAAGTTDSSEGTATSGRSRHPARSAAAVRDRAENADPGVDESIEPQYSGVDSAIRLDCATNELRHIISFTVSELDHTMNSHGHIHIKDNLELLKQLGDESIDLICTNPPFYKQYGRPVPEGLNTQVSNLKNTWTQIEISPKWKSRIQRDSHELFAILDSIRTVHSRQLYNYLVFLTVRLIEMRRLLCREGSIFLHCGSDYSHYVRLCMDCIFGKDRFQNEIIRCYAGRGTRMNQGHFQRKHDIVLFYSRSNQHRFYRDTALRMQGSYTCPQSIRGDLKSLFRPRLENEDLGRVLREDW